MLRFVRRRYRSLSIMAIKIRADNSVVYLRSSFAFLHFETPNNVKNRNDEVTASFSLIISSKIYKDTSN